MCTHNYRFIGSLNTLLSQSFSPRLYYDFREINIETTTTMYAGCPYKQTGSPCGHGVRINYAQISAQFARLLRLLRISLTDTDFYYAISVSQDGVSQAPICCGLTILLTGCEFSENAIWKNASAVVLPVKNVANVSKFMYNLLHTSVWYAFD